MPHRMLNPSSSVSSEPEYPIQSKPISNNLKITINHHKNFIVHSSVNSTADRACPFRPHSSQKLVAIHESIQYTFFMGNIFFITKKKKKDSEQLVCTWHDLLHLSESPRRTRNIILETRFLFDDYDRKKKDYINSDGKCTPNKYGNISQHSHKIGNTCRFPVYYKHE